MPNAVKRSSVRTHHPGQREQQREARHHREAEAEPPCPVALRFGQPADQDRDEDDVVDAENDLERHQHKEGNPDVGVQQGFHAMVLRGVGNAPTPRPRWGP
jgi:hypothetical protein